MKKKAEKLLWNFNSKINRESPCTAIKTLKLMKKCKRLKFSKLSMVIRKLLDLQSNQTIRN